MAFILLTQEAADLLGIDWQKSDPPPSHLPSLEDWLLDVVRSDGDNHGIIFYNKLTGFAVGLRPMEYNLDYCMDVFEELLLRLLNDNGLTTHVFHLFSLFRTQCVYRNNDKSENANMRLVKSSIIWWLNPANKSRVNNSYDLLHRINDECRVGNNYRSSILERFLNEVRHIGKPPRNFSVPPDLLGQEIN
jgi:hypothetical protein